MPRIPIFVSQTTIYSHVIRREYGRNLSYSFSPTPSDFYDLVHNSLKKDLLRYNILTIWQIIVLLLYGFSSQYHIRISNVAFLPLNCQRSPAREIYHRCASIVKSQYNQNTI